MEAIAKPAQVPSKYQMAIFSFMGAVVKGVMNAVVSAVAGSGKTTTILNCLKLVPSTMRSLYLAFNRDIVTETVDKVREKGITNVDVKTLHGYGLGVLNKNGWNIQKKNIDVKKYQKLLSAIYKYVDGETDAMKPYVSYIGGLINKLYKFKIEQPEDESKKIDVKAYADRVVKLSSFGRLYLTQTVEELEELAKKYDISLTNGEANQAMNLILLGRLIKDQIDYTDMIYMPIIYNLVGDRYDWIFVDECQDLNVAQRTLMLRAIKPNTGRFIAVGDPYQAIYRFAGADADSYKQLVSLPNTIELPLSCCYRCGSKIVELAKTIVPHIEAAEKAIEGEVNREASKEDIKSGDMVLCRNTYPLVRMCYDYLKKGIKATIKGKDFGENLINMIEFTNEVSVNKILEKLDAELNRILQKIMRKQNCNEQEAMQDNAYVTYHENIEIIEFLATGSETKQDIINKLKEIFSDSKDNVGIQMSTIHRSKGLEADRVFIIHEELMPSKYAKTEEEKVQEQNLIYVAYTRAKKFLGFVVDFDAYRDKPKYEKKEGEPETKKIERYVPNPKSEFQGTEGKKLLVELTIVDWVPVDFKGSDNQTKEVNLWTMIDDNNNVFKKFGEVPDDYIISEHTEACIGARIRVNATVKKHNVFRGVKETMLSYFARPY